MGVDATIIPPMLALLLQTAKHATHAAHQVLQQAPTIIQQAAPPVYVTVQQPSGGMPEWVKILISAATGALFGICGNIAMEFVKPRIAGGLLKKSMAKQLLPEARNILQDIERAKKVAKDAAPQQISPAMASSVVVDIMKSLTWNRYKLFEKAEPRALYEIDPDDEYGKLTEWIDDVVESTKSADMTIVEGSLDECGAICQNIIDSLEEIKGGTRSYIQSAAS
jgi:hypothetical protein